MLYVETDNENWSSLQNSLNIQMPNTKDNITIVVTPLPEHSVARENQTTIKRLLNVSGYSATPIRKVSFTLNEIPNYN